MTTTNSNAEKEGPSLDLRFSSQAQWDINNFDAVKKAFKEHPCRNPDWNALHITKANGQKFLTDHENCIEEMYAQNGKYENYRGCIAATGCKNGLTYGLPTKDKKQEPDSPPTNEKLFEFFTEQFKGLEMRMDSKIEAIATGLQEQIQNMQTQNEVDSRAESRLSDARRGARERRQARSGHAQNPNPPNFGMFNGMYGQNMPNPNWRFYEQRQNSSDESVIFIGEIQAPARQRHMSAEAEHALRKLQSGQVSRDVEVQEKGGEDYYESLVEETNSADDEISTASYTVDHLYEHKCATEVKISGNKDLSYTKREEKFDKLHFTKWSKNKESNLWNHLWQKYFEQMTQHRFTALEIVYFLPKIFDQALDLEIKQIVNTTLEDNLICEYEFEFAKKRKDTATMNSLKSGLISLPKVKKATLVQVACQISGFSSIAEIPIWDRSAGVRLKKWYRTLLDRQQVLHQSGTLTFNKYTELMKRAALKDLINGLKEKNDSITIQKLYNNRLLTLFLEAKNKNFVCPAIKDIETELETVEALASQYRHWDEDARLHKTFEAKQESEFDLGMKTIKNEMNLMVIKTFSLFFF